MSLETVRLFILVLGWPILFIGTIYLFFRAYRFYIEVQKNVWGKLVLIMVTGWLITMYSLGIVSTVFMLKDVINGVYVVLPIFTIWFLTMGIIVRSVLIWNKEAVQVNKFNLSLQSMVDERTKDLLHEKQMAEAERNKMKVVIASITDGILAIDLDHRIILGNEAIEQITGYKLEELIGKTVIEKLQFFENGQQIGQAELCPIRKDGYEGTLVQKQEIKLKGNNTEKYISLVVSQITEGMAVNLGCIMTFHDMTKEQELEEMKLDFVSMAAHELRTPLTSIRGYTTLIQDEFFEYATPTTKEYMNRLTNSINNLNGLLDNLLNVSRIERNTFKIETVPLDLVELVQNTVTALDPQATSKEQQLVFIRPAHAMPKVMADNFRITQVITNLVANAIAYTPEKGTITLSLQEEGNVLHVSIADTGQGIPSEALPKLFTKFFRVSGKLEQGSKGTGLGLYITKSIITTHQGTIWVESTLGKGTTFHFTLPIAAPIELEKYAERMRRTSLNEKQTQGIILNKDRLPHR